MIFEMCKDKTLFEDESETNSQGNILKSFSDLKSPSEKKQNKKDRYSMEPQTKKTIQTLKPFKKGF